VADGVRLLFLTPSSPEEGKERGEGGVQDGAKFHHLSSLTHGRGRKKKESTKAGTERRQP